MNNQFKEYRDIVKEWCEQCTKFKYESLSEVTVSDIYSNLVEVRCPNDFKLESPDLCCTVDTLPLDHISGSNRIKARCHLCWLRALGLPEK